MSRYPSMNPNWFYEHDGKKTGPVPDATLKHLASCGIISPNTNIWKVGMEESVAAAKVKNLFEPIRKASENALLALKIYLDVEIEYPGQAHDLLINKKPRIGAVLPHFLPDATLMDYAIKHIFQIESIDVATLPSEEKTKPIKNSFIAIVYMTYYETYQGRISAEDLVIWKKHKNWQELVVLECREFEDGDYIFLKFDVHCNINNRPDNLRRY